LAFLELEENSIFRVYPGKISFEIWPYETVYDQIWLFLLVGTWQPWFAGPSRTKLEIL
jgi:hypothetical protein